MLGQLDEHDRERLLEIVPHLLAAYVVDLATEAHPETWKDFEPAVIGVGEFLEQLAARGDGKGDWARLALDLAKWVFRMAHELTLLASNVPEFDYILLELVPRVAQSPVLPSRASLVSFLKGPPPTPDGQLRVVQDLLALLKSLEEFRTKTPGFQQPDQRLCSEDMSEDMPLFMTELDVYIFTATWLRDCPHPCKYEKRMRSHYKDIRTSFSLNVEATLSAIYKYAHRLALFCVPSLDPRSYIAGIVLRLLTINLGGTPSRRLLQTAPNVVPLRPLIDVWRGRSNLVHTFLERAKADTSDQWLKVNLRMMTSLTCGLIGRLRCDVKLLQLMGEISLHQCLPRCDPDIGQFRSLGQEFRRLIECPSQRFTERELQQTFAKRYQDIRQELLDIYDIVQQFRHPEDKLDNWDFPSFTDQFPATGTPVKGAHRQA